MKKYQLPRRNSSIVHSFIATTQSIQLANEAGALKEIDVTIKSRRDERAKLHPTKESKKAKDGISEGLKNAEKFKSMQEHRMPLDQLYEQMHTNPEKGLNQEQATELNKKLGDNALTEKSRTPWYIMLLKEYFTVFACILWVGAVLAFVAYALTSSDPSNLILALSLAFVILASGTGSFIQSHKSEAIMEGFKNFIPQQTLCIRDGKEQQILASKLVPGDIVEVREGNKIPADIRVISCSEMRVNNSSLTGESEPLLRGIECTHPDNPLETKNVCFFGTICAQGRCRGIVLNIGDLTVIGQIASLASSAGAVETPLQREIERFIYIIASIASFMGLLCFGVGFALGYDALTNMLFMIGLITGNAPEGLIVTVTVALTLCAKKLATKHVLCKNLQSVETLGSTCTICSDKTGTLTQNRMTIQNLWFDGNVVRGLNKQKFEKDGFKVQDLPYKLNSTGFKTLHEVAVLSSEATFEPELSQEAREKVVNKLTSESEKKLAIAKAEEEFNQLLWLDRPVKGGNASEDAIIKFFQPIEDIHATRNKYPMVTVEGMPCTVPFNSTNKFAISIVKEECSGSFYTILMKGAPERIVKLCDKILINEKEVPFDQELMTRYETANKNFARGGERVLGFARLRLSGDKFKPLANGKDYQFNTSVAAKAPEFREWNFPLKEMTFVGLTSLIDPPRETVPFAIKKCKTAGIKVIMVTGDQPDTAQAIARQVNILNETVKTNLDLMEENSSLTKEEAIMRAEAVVIHGDLITEATKEDDSLPESEKGKKLSYWLSKKQIVFARTSPAQKLIIVQGCQARNEVVAVTGDGVNDSPAIKKADIGIAMGQTGSDIAKDAADLVLLTDDFSALILGIEEGRRIFDNLKKCVSYSITVNIPEIIPFIVLILGRIPLPVNTILLLAVCIGTDMFPAISLAYEEAELDIMIRKPRDRHEHLVTRKLMTYCYVQMGWFESFGTWLIYFICMSDWGFTFSSLFGMGLQTGYGYAAGDVYNPYDPYFGNSQLRGACDNGQDLLGNNQYSQYNYAPDWIYNADIKTDLRMVYVECGKDANGILTGALASTTVWGTCSFKQVSGQTGIPVCYTTESIKYVQTSFFIGFIMGQIANLTAHKGRRNSIFFQGFRNYYQIWGYASMIIGGLLFAYIPGLNSAIGTRDVDFLHFGMAAVPFSLFISVYDELRKILVNRSANVKDGEKPGWWARNYAY